MNPFLEIRGLGHCMAPIGVRVVSLASEIGMGHYSDAPLCAASEAAAAGPDFSFVRYNPTGFFMQEAQITACVYLEIGMGHYSDAPLCAASEAAAAGPDFSFVRYNPTGFFMQEAQITACVCL